MTNFTPLTGMIGGALIGLAAALLVLINGRIAGISGILGGVLGASGDDARWRWAFLAGLVAGPLVVAAGRGALPEITPQASWPMLIVAGLLVGFGTRLGSGCTSGHGVCGIARGAPRSIWATVVFFAVAAVTVFVTCHVIGG
jgi:uncharacterized membrane protein YedE/YeeE